MAKTNANKDVPPQQGRYAFMCGTPKDSCSGSKYNVSHGMGGGAKAHGSSEEAFRCHKRYLVSAGYKIVGSRELINPESGAIHIMTKRTRFGAKLRNGKAATRNQPMGVRAGVIIST